jgi:hypothetical protein
MLKKKDIVAVPARGAAREQVKAIETKEERERLADAEALGLKENVVLGPRGDVASNNLNYRNMVLDVYLGPVLEGWVTAGQRREFSRGLGFNETLYRRFFDRTTGDDAEAFCRQYGFKDKKSYGSFVSLAYFRDLPSKGEFDLRRAFGGYLAEPLLKQLGETRDPDAAIENFSMLVKPIPPEPRTALYYALAQHPMALKRLLEINHLDGIRLKNFFERFVKNQASFDGVIQK